ncbi:hypothetical protein L3X38_038485 [Prunus dulcis]|uniref:Uncharacterized protein n=1 Tax=Prunus dulcis TaxID=3755 RepID=A0AAD4V6Y6_PRUDU|nr:hypothetical protein L3X38_038485 [Prunus dulcis]
MAISFGSMSIGTRPSTNSNESYDGYGYVLSDYRGTSYGAQDDEIDYGQKSPSYKEVVTQMWNFGGDVFDSLSEEGVGMLEIANLCLDEPLLEVALFTREDITNIVVD